MGSRLFRRRSIAISFRVFDDETGAFIGRIGDISKGGMLVYGPAHIQSDDIHRLKIGLPDDQGKPRSVTIHAKAMWSHTDVNPDFFGTGFRFVDLDNPENKAALDAMLSRFTVGMDEDEED
jgi:hypothetical protein